MLIENEDVHRAVAPSPRMDLPAGCPAHGFIALVDDVENLLSHALPLHSSSFRSIVAVSPRNIMPKIDVSKVAEILKKNQIEPSVLRRVIEELNLAVQPDPGDDDKPPAVKKQFVILVSDPENRLPPKAEFAGWVLQIPENESVVTTQERIFRSAYDYNASRKGRLYPAKTVGEALENVPAKHFKEAEVWVKTKTPVLLLKTDNEIPKA